MKRPSIVNRVVRGMTLVAILCSLALAGTAALISRIVWRSNEEMALDGMTNALASAILAEASEENTAFEEAAPEAIKDATIAGYQVEVWIRGKLSYIRPSGEPMGPAPSETGQHRRGRWLLQTREFPDGTVLVVGTTEAGERAAIGIFVWSLF